ncbi:MAG: efflux RND transporter periplasmic adaptor subunit, partial [Alphaproteobacteria bacterium]|nr:efflux RND transporter periplasmic adaptor subunit [Alphaproteobacteria bacterium]
MDILKQHKKIIVIAAVAALIVYFSAGRIMMFMGASMMGGPQGPAPVSVAAVIERSVQQWHEFSGRLVAVDTADIRPRVSGTIDAIHFKEGEWVEKDQPLFTIDPRPYQAALQAAQARSTLASEEFKRAKVLLENKAISQRDYDTKRNNDEVAKADLTRAQLDFDYTVVKAPVAGHVGRAEITVGNLVDAGANAPVLTTVISDRPIYADFTIDEQTFLTYLQAVGTDTAKLGEIPVYLGLSGGEEPSIKGQVQSFDNRVDPSSGTIRVRAVFANEDAKLIPGLFARIRLGNPVNAPVQLITDRAVGTDQDKKFVLVVGDDTKVSYREITLGAAVDGLRVVTSGLKAGEKIIVNGLQRARPGAEVTPEVVAMDAPETAPQAAA